MVVFLFLFIAAEPQNFNVTHLTTNDGLSSGNVWSILQDRKGYMWFGTEDGLNKYDGYKFTVYRNNPVDVTSLSDNWVQSIVEDIDGLWIGTRNGLCKYSYQSDNFRQYFHNENDSNSISNNTINNILKDRKGQIWVGTTMGLNLYDRKNDNFLTYSFQPERNIQTGSNQVRGITIDANDLLLLSTMNGLYQFNPYKDQFAPYMKEEMANEDFGTGFIVCTFIDRKSNVWIGTESKGLFYFDKAHHKLYHFTHQPNDPHSLCYNGINNIMEDNKGNIWISTKGGLSFIRHGTNMEQRDGIFNNLKQESQSLSGISTNIINIAYLDRNNRLWIGGRFGDIDILNDQNSKFLSVKFTDIDNRFSSNNMTAMVEDKNENIWFGTDGGGIYYWDRKNDKYIVYKHNSQNRASLASDKVIALCLDNYNNLWVGMWNGGIDKFDLTNNIYTHYRYNPYDSNSLSSDNVYFIKEDSQKNIWIGLWFGGLNQYDRTNDCFKRFQYGSGDSIVMSGYTIIYIHEDKRNNLWIGSEANGLNLLNKENSTFKKYIHNKQDSSSISNNAVTCIYEDTHNRLWIGTRGGLNLFNRETQTFRNYTISDGLPNDIICRILEDGKGNLWLSTIQGLSEVTINVNSNDMEAVFKNFDQSDGLQSNQFNLWAGLKTKRGELLFGGINGISIFYPDSIQDNIIVPPVVITEFSIFNKPVPVGEPGSPLLKHIGETKKITLSYKQSVISFEYAALNFISTEKNEYAYMLEGFENHWNYVGNQRKATYTNLDPGKYIFRVKGCNNDGYWNEEGVSIVLIITPPWWKTLFFKIFFIAFMIALLSGFFFYRINRFSRQRELLESLVKDRTMEAEERNAKLMQQSEELNEINSLLEERQQHIEEQDEQLLTNNEHLMQVNEILQEKQEMVTRQAEMLEEANRKLAETNQELSILNATKDKFFSIIAHDLKNPFGSILSFSEILLTRFQGLTDEKKLKFIQIINDSSQRVYSLLENLLQWARTQTGNIQYDPEVFDLNEVVDANHELVKEMLEEKEITFTRVSTENTLIFADRNMINTVVRNLLGNAIKYTEKGTIALDIKRNKDLVEVSITDSGVGISDKKMFDIFNVVQDKSTSGTRGEKGSGLGLLICKEFVQRNGGEISVRSIQGKGTTFSFTVPLKP